MVWSRQLRGTLVTALGVLTLTPDTLMIRLVHDVDDFTVQFYRYMLNGLTLLFIYLIYNKGDLRKFGALGWTGVLAGLLWGVSNLTFTWAVQSTAVANVLVILAGGNLSFTSILSYLILGERIPLYTMVACLCAFAAILLTFSDQLAGKSGQWQGNVLALFASLTLALYFVLVRLAGEALDMVPCNIIAGVFVGCISLILGAKPSSVPLGPDLAYLVLQGCVLLTVSFALLTIGGSMIPAPEVSMLLLLETLLGPVWVFLGGFEAPPFNTIYGGALLIVTIILHSAYALREENARLKAVAEAESKAEGEARSENEGKEGKEEEEKEQQIALVFVDGVGGATTDPLHTTATSSSIS
jgi:drug/metabolite transporter (DMT)-like permease